ncbi:MAG: TlpA disulfide reductase family protein [Halothiobacillaceae bacterium]
MKLAVILRDLSSWRILGGLLLGLVGAMAVGPVHAKEQVLRAGEVEWGVSVVEAQQPRAVLLWLPSEHGVQEGQRRVAEALAAHGIETWLVDPFTTWMLPVSESSLMALPVDGLAHAIEAAAAQAPAPLILVSHDRGSVPLLEALRRWQRAHPGDARVRGVLLITPNLFLETPAPGQAARLTPAARRTNLPLFLIQPELSTTALRLPELLEALSSARVYWRGVPEARDRFFFRSDATVEELTQAERLPGWMAQGVQRLLREAVPATAVKGEDEPIEPTASPHQRGWVVVGERPLPPALALPGLDGAGHDLAALRGKVVLVNFWASWCPPCVHEMPSMQQLWQDLHGQGLEILAVNLGEKEPTVRDFVARHRLGFSILLDPARMAAKAWQVYAYPTSFLIDRQGRIRLAVAGGVDWNEPGVRTSIRALLDEKRD